MDVLAFVTQKGGTGKSSLAVSLAVAAHASGTSTALIDIDPQGTTTAWGQRRQAEGPMVESISWSYLGSRLHRLKQQGVGLVVIDTPGADGTAASAAMQEADLCLIPVRPSVADIEATKPTIRFLSERDKPFAFVLNQCPAGGRTSRTSNAFRALQLISAVCDATLAFRSDHMDAVAAGLGVTEHAPRGRAAEEVLSLLEWIRTRLRRQSQVTEAAE
jgi:chromosome partitioning protein